MKHLIISSLLVFFFFSAISHPVFINIELQPISCQSYNYNIIVNIIYPESSDILFGGIEVGFGDGVIIEFSRGEMDITSLRNGMTRFQKKFNHAFPGPGNYKIAARTFNRSANIVNMKISVNTPLYIETRLLLDPNFGCNTIPHLENYTYPFIKNGQNYNFDFSFIDDENDSVSFSFTSALQDKEIEAINYELPTEYDDSHLRKISKISIDPFHGFLLWNSKKNMGNYSIVIKMEEWRKIDGEYYPISQSTIDYIAGFYDTNNNPPEIWGLQDTAIVAGNNYINEVLLTDPEDDSLQMLVYGDLVMLFSKLPKNEYTYQKGPLNYSIDFQPTSAHARSKPYKLLISSTDQNEDLSLNQTKSIYIWIANRKHQPDPPAKILAQAYNTDLVGIYWSDTEDELGYILERSDHYFPEFEKIAVLPANTTTFYDSSVVENNTYQYRIKAVGTNMSDYVIAEVETPNILTSLNDDLTKEFIQVYPNPSRGIIYLAGYDGYRSVKILDIAGKTVYDQSLKNQNITTLAPSLKPGTYVLCLIGDDASKKFKLEITN